MESHPLTLSPRSTIITPQSQLFLPYLFSHLYAEEE